MPNGSRAATPAVPKRARSYAAAVAGGGWGLASELVRKALDVALRFRRVRFPDVARGFIVDVECGAVEAALAQRRVLHPPMRKGCTREFSKASFIHL